MCVCVCCVCTSQINSKVVLSDIVQGNRSLTSFDAIDNACFSENSPDDRVGLLTLVPRCALQGFRLTLNGAPVTLEERLTAVAERRMAVPVRVIGMDLTSTGGEQKGERGHLRSRTSSVMSRGSTSSPAGGSVGMGEDGGTPRVTELPYDGEVLRRLRLALVMYEGDVKGGEHSVDLRDRQLDYVADLVRVLPSVCVRVRLRV